NGVAMTMSGQITNGTQGGGFAEYALSSTAGVQNASFSFTGVPGVNGGQATFTPVIAASVTVTAGSLAYASTPGNITFPGITLDGSAQTSNQSMALDVSDLTG